MAPFFVSTDQKLVGPGGLEPPTSRLSGVRSNHLSYGPDVVWTELLCLKLREIEHPSRSKSRSVSSGLAGTLSMLTIPRGSEHDVLVKKEKRRRRVFRSFGRL